MQHYYPLVNFHFVVSFLGLGDSGQGIDGHFQSVSGLKMEFETDTIKEGGENQFTHELPARRKYSDLVLKRGVFSPAEGSVVTKWFKQAFENYIILPVDLTVILLNENHEPLMKWDVVHAWPKSWNFGDLNAENGAVLIEDLALKHNRCIPKNT